MTDDPSFSDLVRRLRAGDQQSVAELLRLYEPEIRRLIRLNLTDPKLRRVYESGDIFQSVFANFYVRFLGGQYDLEQPWQFVHLLATMARNRIMDHARRPGNRVGWEDPDMLAETAAREPSPSAMLSEREALEKVRGLLSDEDRFLAEGRAEGRSWSDLAAEVGGTPDGLRKQLERALDRVCQLLGTGGGGWVDLIVQIRDDQRQQWQAGRRVPVEDYLQRHPALSGDQDVTLDLICWEVMLRREMGEQPQVGEYACRFPQHMAPLRRQFELFELLDEVSQPVADAPLPTLPGYEILEKLGRGARGVVYKARQLSLDRLVAVKLLRADDVTGADGTVSFRREAAAVARLQHPNVVQVFDHGEHDGRPFIAMELVGGGNLHQKLSGGALPPREAAGLVEALARGVQAAHERGIVHRDLKPANVLLTPEGTPKVADFGLAKRLGPGETLTVSGAVVGTAAYMAPEQAAGQSRQVGPASDVYSLGTILYETVTGRPPFWGGEWLEMLSQVRFREPEPPRRQRPGVPRDLETICLKCLRKDSKHRYASAAALADDLRRFLDGRPIQARPERLREKAARAARRHPLVCAAALLLILATAGTLLALNVFDPGRPRQLLKDRLARGLPVALSGGEAVPGPFRQVVGSPAVLWVNKEEQCLVTETLDSVLWELTDDPMCDRYLWSAEIRHDASSGLSDVGLYIGHRTNQPHPGRKQGAYYIATFADRGSAVRRDPKNNPFSRVQLSTRLFDDGNSLNAARAWPIGSKKFPAAAPLVGQAPWRKIRLEVTPQGVKGFWEREPGLFEPFCDANAEDLPRRINDLTAITDGMGGVPKGFQPRLGLGLYVSEGKASFRQMTLEPLAGGG